jgi:DNA-binding NarL/FixJ family response regulator
MKPKAQDGADKNKIRIMIVDDHALLRQSLIKLIKTEFDLMVCFEASNANQALETMDRQEYDLAIVDISMEGINGFELTEIMKLRSPNMIILILSMYDGLLYTQRAIRAGASGYVAKYEAAEQIITAIHQVLNGKIYVSNNKMLKFLPETTSIVDDNIKTNNAT